MLKTCVLTLRQMKNVICKKISEIFDLFFFFLGFLAIFNLFCGEYFVNFDLWLLGIITICYSKNLFSKLPGKTLSAK